MPEPEGNLTTTIEGIFGIVTRRRWWILGASFCIPIAVVAVAMRLPDRYVSRATLLVVQQKVSQRYVEPDSTTTIPAAIQAIKLEVLSAGPLLGIIKDLGLYPSDKERSTPELLVDRMRQDVDIQPLETAPGRIDFNALTISFTAGTPQLAQEVTSRLTSLFIEQNQRTRGEQATGTTQFLSSQLEAAKQRLAEQEQRLQAFKSSNLGELPEQQSVNLAALMDVRTRLNAVSLSLSQARQQQTFIQSSLNERLTRIEASLYERLTRLQSERAQLLTRYTSRYPDVVEKDHEIEKAQAMLDALKSGKPVAGEGAESPDEIALADIRKQAEANAAEIENFSKQQQKLNVESEQYQTRLNLTPVREQQLAAILRDYELFRQDYTSLLNKKIESQLTVSLEENQQGQQFRLVDPPTLPVKPSSPKRLKICLGGMAGGILLGLVLAFLMDARDDSFHSEKALSQSFALPLVLGVPLVLTPAETRARKGKMVFEWVAGSLMTLTMFAAEFYVFKKG